MRIPLVLAAAAASGIVASAAAAPSSPRLVIDQSAPLVVRGQHFEAGEHVRVTGFVKGTTAVRTATATMSGWFVVRFRALTLAGCGPYGARAVGSDGSKASVRVMPECAPGPAP